MQETEMKELQDSALAMYLGLNALYELHASVSLKSDAGEDVESCEHCSMLADGIVAYPCPSVQIMLTDFQQIIAESSETAESEELSS